MTLPPLTKRLNISFSNRWNLKFISELESFIALQKRINLRRQRAITAGRTMPDISAVSIRSAKRMTAAVLFFDLEDFTSVSAHIGKERTLSLLNAIIPTIMKIVKHYD